LYWSVLRAPFVYDDQDQIQTNGFLVSWGSVFRHYFAAAHPFSGEFRGSGGSSYRPLFWLSLALDRRLFGLNVEGFHATNLLLHWANGLLAFILMRRLGVSQLLAAASALIWLVLPINSEAVAWISGRAYCLLTFFVLLSLLFAERYLRNGARSSFVCCCLAYIGALLSHEAGILVLPLLFLLAYTRQKTLHSSHRPLYVAASAITLAYLGLRIGTLGGSVGTKSWAILPIGTAILKYLAWMVLPIRMSVERSTDTPPNVFSTANVIGLCALSLLVLAAFRLRKNMPNVSAGLTWTLLALAPFCGLVFLYQGMAERYCYLASIGLVFAMLSLASRVPGRARRVAGFVLIVWLGWGVWRLTSRLYDWRDEVALYASSLKADPDSPVLLVNLGSTLSDAGHLTDALLFINRAISVKPDYELAYRDLGNVYLRLGLFEQAKRAYEKAAALQPDDVRAITNLGSTYVRLKDLDGAEREFRRAVSLAPATVGPYCDLGIVLFYEGKPDEALQQFVKGMKLDPKDPNPYYFLGFIEEQTGARDAARQMYEKALQLKPDYAQARAGLERMRR
jgi:Flp pilus assembly protein TadD